MNRTIPMTNDRLNGISLLCTTGNNVTRDGVVVCLFDVLAIDDGAILVSSAESAT